MCPNFTDAHRSGLEYFIYLSENYHPTVRLWCRDQGASNLDGDQWTMSRLTQGKLHFLGADFLTIK